MAEKTEIEWTDHTWNPWQGCHKVSPGCLNCYMYRDKKRYKQDPTKVIRSATRTFNSPLRWKVPALVFVCSWSDFFHEDADEWRDDAWDIIMKNPHLTFQILTKRPDNIADRLPLDWPLPNVWLGVTAENQAMADARIPILLDTPAARRFVSVEPMIEEIDLTQYLEGWDVGPVCCQNGLHRDGQCCGNPDPEQYPTESLDWVICGAESGPDARQMNRDWARGLRDQCAANNVPFMFKQGLDNGKLVKKPFLDGRQHLEMPR